MSIPTLLFTVTYDTDPAAFEGTVLKEISKQISAGSFMEGWKGEEIWG